MGFSWTCWGKQECLHHWFLPRGWFPACRAPTGAVWDVRGEAENGVWGNPKWPFQPCRRWEHPFNLSYRRDGTRDGVISRAPGHAVEPSPTSWRILHCPCPRLCVPHSGTPNCKAGSEGSTREPWRAWERLSGCPPAPSGLPALCWDGITLCGWAGAAAGQEPAQEMGNIFHLASFNQKTWILQSCQSVPGRIRFDQSPYCTCSFEVSMFRNLCEVSHWHFSKENGLDFALKQLI